MFVLYEFVKHKNKVVDEVNIFDTDKLVNIKTFLKLKRNLDTSLGSLKYAVSRNYVVKNNYIIKKIDFNKEDDIYVKRSRT